MPRRKRHRRRRRHPFQPQPQQQPPINNSVVVTPVRRTPCSIQNINPLKKINNDEANNSNMVTPKNRRDYPESVTLPSGFFDERLAGYTNLHNGTVIGYLRDKLSATPSRSARLMVDKEVQTCDVDVPSFAQIFNTPTRVSTPRFRLSPIKRDLRAKEHFTFSRNRPRIYRSTTAYKSSFTKLLVRRNSDACVAKKSFSPIKRCSLERSSNNVLKFGRGSLSSKVQQFHRDHSSKWIEKIVELCKWFGMTLKTGLSAIKKPRAAVTPINDNKEPDVKTIIESLISEHRNILEHHRSEMAALKEHHCSEMRCLKEIWAESFLGIKSELEELRSRMKDGRGCVVTAAAPPPPPPPPPPPMVFAESNKLIINRDERRRVAGKENEDNARPAISVTDILNVKLRKAGDRQQVAVDHRRRMSQPVISQDMLRQVKLRPTSRPATPLGDVSIDLSPSSSLCRLLTKPDNGPRVKRLRRTAQLHSTDELYRRSRGFQREFAGGSAAYETTSSVESR